MRRRAGAAASGQARRLRRPARPTAPSASSTWPRSSTSAGRRWRDWCGRKGNWPRCARTWTRWERLMPEFEDHARSDAPPEDVWKLLYDPGRFPDWWAGVGSVEPGRAGEYTMYPDGYPDFPMAQQLRVTESGVTISCLVSDRVFEWRLAMLDGGAATSITVHVEIPEAEAHRITAQQGAISESLSRLA